MFLVEDKILIPASLEFEILLVEKTLLLELETYTPIVPLMRFPLIVLSFEESR